MKKLLLILLCLPMIGFGQDNIILFDGEEIVAKIIEININDIKYKKISNLDGPLYTLDKNEVFMIKYANGEKEVFDKKDVKKDINKGIESYTLRTGELIPLVFRETLNSKEVTNGQLVRFAVREDVLSDENKIIIKANSIVNGRISNVKKAAWAGQKGKISITINSIRAVDGTSVPVYYNMNNEGKGRQAVAIGVGAVLFFPVLFVKGKQATIESGTTILVETMSDVKFNTFNFEQKDLLVSKIIEVDIIEEEIIEEEIIKKPLAKDYKSSSEHQKALRKYYKSIE